MWIDTRTPEDADERRSLFTTALEQGFSEIIVRAEDRERFATLGRFDALWLGAAEADAGPGTFERVLGEDGERGRWYRLGSAADEEAVRQAAMLGRPVVVEATDWRIIPLENLIADYQDRPGTLLAPVPDAAEAAVMFDTLDVGTDGVVLRPQAPQDIIDLATLVASRVASDVALVEAEVLAVRDGGRGDRVCVDTCSLLVRGEGMLVGSSSKALFLIHSESIESEYVNARPFRVNAGAVHAYVLAPNGRTHYLSEVEAGLPLVAVDHAGHTRTVTVGRAKVESRPLLVVEARPVTDGPEAPGDEAPTMNVVVQNAETIRFVTPGGGAKSVTALRAGDRVLVATFDSARHFGRPIRERLLER